MRFWLTALAATGSKFTEALQVVFRLWGLGLAFRVRV